jgi:hypothetical protein
VISAEDAFLDAEQSEDEMLGNVTFFDSIRVLKWLALTMPEKMWLH